MSGIPSNTSSNVITEAPSAEASFALDEHSWSFDVDEEAVRRCLTEIETLFSGYFDHNWFILVLEDLPLRSSIMSEIRDVLAHSSPLSFDAREVYRRLSTLESFVSQLRRYLLPCLRERLGISGFSPLRRSRDRSQVLLRELAAYTFPANLDALGASVARLRDCYGRGVPHRA